MPLAPGQVEHAARLVAEGWLPLGAGVAMAALAGGWVVLQLRREFAAAKPSTLRRWVLPGLRFAIILLTVWLLCQPRFITTTRRGEPARVLIVADTASSMATAEANLRLGQRLEMFAALDPTTPLPRDRAAGNLAAAVGRLLAALDARRTALGRDLASLDAKLPLGSEGQQRVRDLGDAASAGVEALRALPAPAVSAASATRHESAPDPASQKIAVDLATRLPAFLSSCEALAAEAKLAAAEASDHPQMLQDHLKHLVTLRDAGKALADVAANLQDALDRAALGPAAADEWLARPITRAAIAKTAAARLKAALGAKANVELAQAEGLTDGLTLAARADAAPPSAVLLLTDGAAGAGAAKAGDVQRLAAPLSASDTHIHAVLCAREGVEPADLALVSVDLPGLLLRDASASARLLVKNQLAPGKPATLEVRLGDEVLASKPLDAERRGLFVVDLAFTPKFAGRAQLTFEARAEGPDALPGNERRRLVVDAADEPRRVILLADRLTDDLAAYSEALRAQPAVRLTTILAVGDGSSVKLGSDEGAFPATAEDWKGVAAVVLLGDIPSAWLKAAEGRAAGAIVAALKGEVEAGRVNVLLHPLHREGADSGGSAPAASWAERLGLALQPLPQPGRPTPVEGLWWDGYRAGLDARASLDAWSSFAGQSSGSFTPAGAFPLLTIDHKTVAGLVPLRSARGGIVFNGLGSLAALRNDGTAPLLNGLVRGLVDLAVRPLYESPGGVILLPRQPTRESISLLLGAKAIDGFEQSKTPPLSVVPTDNAGEPSRGAGALSILVGDVREGVHLDSAGKATRFAEPRPSDADLHLAGSSAFVRALSDATGGSTAAFDDLAPVVDAVSRDLAPHETLEVRATRLWRGWWPLAMLLALVSAEYLLRRRAGRVM